MEWVKQAVVMVAALALAVAAPARAAEVPVPAEAINDDVAVAVWVDLEAIDTDAILSSVQTIADQLPENMAEQREPMVAEAEANLEEMGEALTTLREAGARGLLFVMTGEQMNQQGPGEQPMSLLYTSDDASAESIQDAMRQVNDGGDVSVQEYADGWVRIAEENAVEIRDGEEENAAAFRELLDASGDAPIRVALRLTDDMKQEIAANAEEDPTMAGFAGAIQSLDTGWTTVNFGEAPEIANRLNFADADAAAEFNAAWEGMLMMGEAMVMGQLGQMPEAPDAESVKSLFESLKMEQDEDTLSLRLGEQFIGQAAELAPMAMGMVMMMMMNNAMQQQDGMQQQDMGGEWEEQDGEWEEPAEEEGEPAPPQMN